MEYHLIWWNLPITSLVEALNRELTKHDVSNTDYEIFHETRLSIHNAHAPLKKKHLRANHAAS